MYKVYERSQELKANFGFSSVPVKYFKRDAAGKKEFRFNLTWSHYRNKECPKELFEGAQGLAILTGKASNLVIVDIDSLGVLHDLEKACGQSVESLCGYRVKTNKGCQLFYRFREIPSLVRNKIDVLAEGRITFADSITPGYETCESPVLMDMPDCVYKFLMSSAASSPIFTEKKIQNYYIKPLALLLEKWLENTNSPEKSVKEEISARLLDKVPYDDACEEGMRHTLSLHVAGICAADPTISEDLFHAFCRLFISRVIQPDEEISPLIDYAYRNSFDFEPNWREKHKEMSNIPSRLNALGYYVFFEEARDRYIMTDELGEELELSVSNLKTNIQRILDEDVKVNLREFPRIRKTWFFPDMPYGIVEHRGRLYFNTFNPTSNMEYYSSLREKISNGFLSKVNTLPPFIGAVLSNVFPAQEHRDLFLHNLAYHLHTKEPSMTAIVSLGATQGTGKGVLYDKIIASLYENKYVPDEKGTLLSGSSTSYALKITPQALNSSFNGSMRRKLFMHCNEVVENHSKFNTQSLVNKLKNIVAEEDIVVISKGKDEEVVPNYMFVVMSSNELTPFKIDSADNRRFNFFPTSDKKLVDVYPEMANWGSRDLHEKIIEEMPAFLQYLASIPLEASKYRQVIHTELYENIKEASTPQCEKLANAIINKDISVLEEEASPELFDKFKASVLNSNLMYIPVRDLKELAGPIYNSLKRSLASKGVRFEYRYLPMEKKNARVCLWNPQGTMQVHLTPPG